MPVLTSPWETRRLLQGLMLPTVAGLTRLPLPRDGDAVQLRR